MIGRHLHQDIIAQLLQHFFVAEILFGPRITHIRDNEIIFISFNGQFRFFED